MQRKILAILVSILFIATIPSAIGEIVDSESDIIKPCLDVGRTFYKGLILFPHHSDGNLTFFAVWLWYIKFTPTERECGLIILKWVTIPYRDSAYLGRFYEVGLGLFTYIFGIFQGGLEVR